MKELCCFSTLSTRNLPFFAPKPAVPSVVPSSRSHSVLSVQPIQLSVEGLGMATCLLSPNQVLLTGGSSRVGRRAAPRLLVKSCKGWSSVSVEVSGELGEKSGTVGWFWS